MLLECFFMKKKFLLFLPFIATLLLSCNTNQNPTSSNEPSLEASSSASSEPSLEPSSSTPSDEPSSETPISITLNTPILSLDNDTGLVTWDNVSNAEYYRYYINNENVLTTTTNCLQLTSGSVLSVCAESSLENVNSSSWSNPVVYIKENEEIETINIYFHNTCLKI